MSDRNVVTFANLAQKNKNVSGLRTVQSPENNIADYFPLESCPYAPIISGANALAMTATERE
jgi:hypothetical protein